MTGLDLIGAKTRANRIRAGMVAYVDTLADIADAYAGRDWVTLGYASWDSYVDGEFGETRLQLTREQRADAVTALRVQGMSTRAIGAALGVSKDTIHRELAGAGVSDETPAQVTGADGKTYAAGRPTPAVDPLSPAVAEEIDRRVTEMQAARQEVREINANTSAETIAWAREREWWIGQGTRLARACRLLLDEVTAEPSQLLDELPDNVRSDLSVLPAAHDLLTRLRKEMEARS